MTFESMRENTAYKTAVDDRGSWRDFYMDAWRSLATGDDLSHLACYLVNYLTEEQLVDLGGRVACLLEVRYDHRF